MTPRKEKERGGSKTIRGKRGDKIEENKEKGKKERAKEVKKTREQSA